MEGKNWKIILFKRWSAKKLCLFNSSEFPSLECDQKTRWKCYFIKAGISRPLWNNQIHLKRFYRQSLIKANTATYLAKTMRQILVQVKSVAFCEVCLNRYYMLPCMGVIWDNLRHCLESLLRDELGRTSEQWLTWVVLQCNRRKVRWILPCNQLFDTMIS